MEPTCDRGFGENDGKNARNVTTRASENTTAEIEPLWVSYKTASAYCGLGRTTLWKICHSNAIISAKVGSRVLINLPSLNSYLFSTGGEKNRAHFHNQNSHSDG